MSFYITKASGNKEPFDIQKFSLSLKKAGADINTIEQIAQKIVLRTDLRTTHDIYHFALEELKKINRSLAAKYNLKQALLLLGPTGFPFEQFVAHIFQSKGYKTETDQVIPGFCVRHEVDLVAHNHEHSLLAECKFHNNQALTTDVKVALYVSARFHDIQKLHYAQERKSIHESWVITNTRFTSDAIGIAAARILTS